MQLILETEPNIDIKKDMAKLNEPLHDKIITNGISEEPKTDMFEKNKKSTESLEDFIDAETDIRDDKITEENVVEEINTELSNQEKNYLPTQKETTQCSSLDADTNLMSTEDNAIDKNVTKNNKDEELQKENICENEDVCEGKKIKKEYNGTDIEPTKPVDTNLTGLEDNEVENGSTNNKAEEIQEKEELQSDNVNEDVCEENNVKQECHENDEEPAELCQLEKYENDVACEDTEENRTENNTSINKEIEIKEVVRDIDIDEDSNVDDDGDIIKIEHELNSDEENNVASDDASSVNQENSNSVNEAMITKDVNVFDGPEENVDSKIEISETLEKSLCTNDKSLSNDALESGYVTAIQSVDDQEKCIVNEALSDALSNLPCAGEPDKNPEKDTLETDSTQISLTDESNEMVAIDDKSDIIQMPLSEMPEAYDQAINIDNNVKDHKNNLSGDITQTPIHIDDDIKDIDHENNESSDMKHTPLIDESKIMNADSPDKVMDVDDYTHTNVQEKMEVEEISQTSLDDISKKTASDSSEKIIDVDSNLKDDAQETEGFVKDDVDTGSIKEVKETHVNEKSEEKKKPAVVSKLSNTLNILSDDEDEPPKITDKTESQLKETASDKQCINIEDDDDIMLIDEDTDSKESRTGSCDTVIVETQIVTSNLESKKDENNKSEVPVVETVEFMSDNTNKESTPDVTDIIEQPQLNEKPKEQISKINTIKPLLPENFLKSAKKNLVDMTRDDLEEFCILKIVESVVDRSNLNEIKTKLKNMTQIVKEYSNKAKMLAKQNRDLQVVMKSIQEEQKKNTNAPIAPLKITRSVGMQVFMTDKIVPRRKGMLGANPTQGNSIHNLNTANKQTKANNPVPRTQRQGQANNQNQTIPVPRLVPATQNNVTAKLPPNQVTPVSNQSKTSSPVTNGVKNAPSSQKSAEKRTLNRIQSITVDLTDDEPPAKVPTRSSTAQPVRVVPSQSLMAPQRPQLAPNNTNSPRKVYIPISGPQAQGQRLGQFMLKSVSPSAGPRPRGPASQISRMPQNPVRVQRVASRHPAPLPDAMKQYQPPNWKSLPPAPDIKLSKVENGIVISWKIDDYMEDVHEEIASYQLYAYQETPCPPSTALWKKIGDVKALPLPMACTLTQFRAGFKYFFAVRAIDVRSRLGPFSVPGSILLLNKM